LSKRENKKEQKRTKKNVKERKRIPKRIIYIVFIFHIENKSIII